MENSGKLPQLLGWRFVGVVALASLPIGNATAATLSGGVTTERISGYAGTTYQIGKADGERAVYGLFSAERSDNPCYLASMTENVNDSRDDSGGIRDLCGNRATSSTITAQFSDSQFADHTFVRSLRVCMNNKNTRVKGFQIRGRKVESDGRLVDLDTDYPQGAGGLNALVDQNAPSDQRNNCSKWKRWSNCPSGTIATALEAHFEAGSTPRSLTGIALKCRGVRP